MKMASSSSSRQQENDNNSSTKTIVAVGSSSDNDDDDTLLVSSTKLAIDDSVDTTKTAIKTTVIKKPLTSSAFAHINNSCSYVVDNDNDNIINIRKTFLPNKLIQDIRNNSATSSRNFNSLPLFQYVAELSEIGSGQPVMECMPLRQPTGGAYHHHYHQHVTDQTKSLQELQNEVGALLEFRDLVIETFPDLKHKMASISATNTLTGMVSNSSLASRREWEPGIRVKRKLIQQKDTPASPATTTVSSSSSSNGGTNGSGSTNNNNNIEMSSSSSLIRSRSNSHSGKKEPKSGEGNGSVVQDSGFSTETSSSKEAHSASSTTGAMQGAVATNRLLPNNDSDDELLNLLDVIHRKSNRLREEVEHLQSLERDNKIIRGNSSSHIHNNNHNSTTTLSSTTTSTTTTDTSQIGCINHKQFQEHIDRLNKEDIQLLRRERDRLLDKLAEMEAETLTGRIKATKIQDQFEELITVKKELEEQLKLALSQKLELNSRLNDLNKQYSSSKSSSSQSDSSSHRHSATTVLAAPTIAAQQNLGTTDNSRMQQQQHGLLPTTFSPVILDNNDYDDNNVDGMSVTAAKQQQQQLQKSTALYPFHSDIKQFKFELKNLGRLDGIISVPNRLGKVRVTDSKKIAAILLETNVIELQRHLLTLTVQNQVLTQRLEQATKSKMFLNKRLEKSKEDLDDLRFQLEEKDIELEGTKAQLRVLESRTPSKIDFNMTQETNRSTSTLIINRDLTSTISSSSSSILLNSPVVVTQISTPSMKAMIPLQMDEINQQHSSSTESAQDQTERGGILLNTSSNTGTATILTSSNDTSFNNQQTPKRRPPSKIPLPGSKGYLAPKPPSGRHGNIMARSSISGGSTTSSSGPVSNKSLSRSTGNLYGKSPNSLSQHNIQLNINRPDSAQSYRKDNSLNNSGGGGGGRSSTSSIPISSTSPIGTTINSTITTTTNNNNNNKSNPSPQQKFHLNNSSSSSSSPVPIKPKRDNIYNNMSSRARHLDSLTRLHTVTSSSSALSTSGFGNNSNNSGGNISGSSFLLNNSNNNCNNNSSSTIITTNHRINNSKKDLSSNNSFTHLRKNSTASSSSNNIAVNSTTSNQQRRVSSSSIGRNPIGDAQQQQQQTQQQNDTDSGKITKIRKMLSIDSLDNTTTSKIIKVNKNLEDDEFYNDKNNLQNITIINSPTIRRRDLVHEFMLRNYPPPAILQPTNHLTYLQNIQQNSSEDMLLNYSEFCDNKLNGTNTNNIVNIENCVVNDDSKENHQPQLLFEIEMEEHEDDHESDQDKEDFAQYILNESLLLQQQRSKDINIEHNLNSSQLLPPLNGVVRTTINNDSECRLIGNVNPNIAKTWQQLNSNLNTTSSYNNKIDRKYSKNGQQKKLLTRSISNNSDESEKILFYQQVYENKDNFQVNKVKYSREDLSIEIEEDELEDQNNSIESYFDSIENDVQFSDNEVHENRNELQFNYDDDNNEFSDAEQFNDDPRVENREIDNIISHSNQEGGEQMADIDSFERKKYVYTNWSLENDSYV